MPKRVLIFGATSAIAADVARLYAARGARLHLVGRTREKLEELAAELLTLTQVSTTLADLTDFAANEALVAACLDDLGGVDIALIAHGDLGDQLATERDFAAAKDTLDVNLLSVVSLLIPLANHLEDARGGQLAVLSSVAGERGRPRNYTYAAAKGALNIYLQGLRSRLVPAKVAVSTLKLGPADTPMTREHHKTWAFSTKERVAFGIVHALDRRRAEAFVPGYWRFIMVAVRATPEAIFQRLRFLSGR